MHSNQREVHSSARTESGLQDVQEDLMASIRDGLQGGHHALQGVARQTKHAQREIETCARPGCEE